MSAELDRGMDDAAAEGGYSEADALSCAATDTCALIQCVREVEDNMGIGSVTIQPKPAQGLCLTR